jgi:hypothetical protein
MIRFRPDIKNADIRETMSVPEEPSGPVMHKAEADWSGPKQCDLSEQSPRDSQALSCLLLDRVAPVRLCDRFWPGG